MTNEQKEQLSQMEKELLDLKMRITAFRRDHQKETVQDWELLDLDGKSVKLSELFQGKRDLLLVHNMGSGCNYCTLWADGFTGFAKHLNERAAFVLCSGDSPDVAKAFLETRGWNFKVVSGKGSDFAKAMGFSGDEGLWPGVSAFHLNDDGALVRTGWAHFGPGDDFCSVWPFFDLLEGGDAGWEPS